MSYTGKVHDLLYAAGRQESKTGLATGHHIRMIPENRERMAGHSPGTHMEDAGQKLTCYFIHIRYHKQQALGCGEGGCQCPCGKRTVYRAGSTGLRLHLDNPYLLAEDVFSSAGTPLIHMFCHRR